MVGLRFKDVVIDSLAVHMPSIEVTSRAIESQISKLYDRLGIIPGTLEKLTGVGTRYFWEAGTLPSQVATKAAEKALQLSSVVREEIKVLFNCSVMRDVFEPATACFVHKNLKLPETSIVLDITNACIGFVNGIVLLANLIAIGAVKAGIVVSGETMEPLVKNTIDQINTNIDKVERDDLIKMLPTLTLGSGAVACVLAHSSVSKSTHRLVGMAGRADTQSADLCKGSQDFGIANSVQAASGTSLHSGPIMMTEASKLISAASHLAGRLWDDFAEASQWSRGDINHIIPHQVGKQVNEVAARNATLDSSKQYTIYHKYGNLASAALPTALTMAVDGAPLNVNDKVLLLGFGSGINAMYVGIDW